MTLGQNERSDTHVKSLSRDRPGDSPRLYLIHICECVVTQGYASTLYIVVYIEREYICACKTIRRHRKDVHTRWLVIWGVYGGYMWTDTRRDVRGARARARVAVIEPAWAHARRTGAATSRG